MLLGQFAIIGLVSATCNVDEFDLHKADDGAGVSLLQSQARMHRQGMEAEETWAGGYKRCTEQAPMTQSGCKHVAGGIDFAAHPRFCAEQARVRGIDSFQFSKYGITTECWLKDCQSVDMQFIPHNGPAQMDVFSTSCGLERSHIEKEGDGYCAAAFTNNLIFPPPQRSACRNGLRFRSISNNNLRGFGPNPEDEGHMRFSLVLPGVDLVVKADENYRTSRPQRNGIQGKFGQINVAAGVKTMLNFRFVSTGTENAVEVKEFLFTVFDMDHFKFCNSRKTVNATRFSAYYVGADSSLLVKTDAGGVGRPASSSFASSQTGHGKDNPTEPRALTPSQQSSSVSFLFKQKKFFNMQFEVSKSGGSARNFLFAGKSSITESVCPWKNR